MSKNQVGKTSSTMTVSQLIHVLELVEHDFGDLPVWGECDECGCSDMYVWLLNAKNETEALIIQVSGTGLED